MKRIWIDDVREMPKGYDLHFKSVYEFMLYFSRLIFSNGNYHTLLIDLDHDAGMYANEGGDYIKILEWLEWMNNVNYNIIKPFRFIFKIHSGNPVGIENMERIIEHNNWKYEK